MLKPIIPVLAVASLLSLSAAAHAQISVYLSAPGVAASGFSNIDVETFETLANNNTYQSNFLSPNFGATTGVTGTYQSDNAHPFFVGPGSDAWSFGDNYFAVGAQSGSASPITLQFSASVHYFGFGWAAGDDLNRISLYRGGTLLATFASSDIQNLLSSPTVTAVNGTVYNSSDYLGQPGNTSINSGENYAFVHFIVPMGVDRLDFFNTNTGTGFESDNHTIRLNAPSVTGTNLVFVTNLEAAAPEPGSMALAATGLLALGVLRRRRAR